MIHRPLENLLSGYYDFGPLYYVVVDETLAHTRLVAVHERTHINLATSSTSGLFLKFLCFLSRRPHYKHTPQFLERVFALSVESARDVHEAAATYQEFCVAEHIGYEGAADMEARLDGDYKSWRAIYDDFFPRTIPPWARGNLAYHLSRYALNNTILRDYAELTDNKLRGFSTYLDRQSIDPSRRLRRLMKTIDRVGTSKVFGPYLDVYERCRQSLDEAYETRSHATRRTTYRIQRELHEAIDRSVRPLATVDLPLKEWQLDGSSLVADANALVAGWRNYFRVCEYCDDLDFRFADIDENATVDDLDDRQSTVSARLPQSGLVELKSLDHFIPRGHSLVRAWAHRGQHPEVLSESPRRVLMPGDTYIRFLTGTPDTPPRFIISADDQILDRLLRLSNSTLLIDGYVYGENKRRFKKLENADSIVLVLWSALSHLKEHLEASRELGLSVVRLGTSDGYMIVAERGDGIYHLVPTTGGEESAAFCGLAELGERTRRLEIEGTSLETGMRILVKNYRFLL